MGCCAHFANVKSFDAHMTDDGCRPPESVIRRDGRPRLIVRQSPYGVTWRLAFYGQRPNFDSQDGEADLDEGSEDE